MGNNVSIVINCTGDDSYKDWGDPEFDALGQIIDYQDINILDLPFPDSSYLEAYDTLASDMAKTIKEHNPIMIIIGSGNTTFLFKLCNALGRPIDIPIYKMEKKPSYICDSTGRTSIKFEFSKFDKLIMLP